VRPLQTEAGVFAITLQRHNKSTNFNTPINHSNPIRWLTSGSSAGGIG
jgi:hypothetical protein